MVQPFQTQFAIIFKDIKQQTWGDHLTNKPHSWFLFINNLNNHKCPHFCLLNPWILQKLIKTLYHCIKSQWNLEYGIKSIKINKILEFHGIPSMTSPFLVHLASREARGGRSPGGRHSRRNAGGQGGGGGDEGARLVSASHGFVWKSRGYGGMELALPHSDTLWKFVTLRIGFAMAHKHRWFAQKRNAVLKENSPQTFNQPH